MIRPTSRDSSRHRPWLWIFVLSAILAGGAAEPGSWQRDLHFLTGKIEHLRNRLNPSGTAAEKLSQAEAEAKRLKEILNRMTDAMKEVDSLDSRLHNLQVLELDPKHAEIDRLRSYGNQLLIDINRRIDAKDGEIKRHAAKKPDLTDRSAVAQWNSEAQRLNQVADQLDIEFNRVEQEKQQGVERAIQAYARAQREFAEAQTRRDKLASQLGEWTQEYTEARKPLVERLVDIETQLPLTPFAHSVPGSTDPMPVIQPVGPSTNPHAIDQLRIVTSSSRSAAGRDDQDRDGPTPSQIEARLKSSYVFDDERGMDPAKLPEVMIPEGRPMAETEVVPLVLPMSPRERAKAPPEIQHNPKLKAIEARQRERFKRLNEDYEHRGALIKEGPNAKPEEVLRNQKSIASNQAGAIWDQFAKEAIARGSMDADLEITPKRQQKTVVPPPKESNP